MKLREELEGEQGYLDPLGSQVAGLGCRRKAQFRQGAVEASSVTSAIFGETTFAHLQKSELRLLNSS